MNRFLKFLNIIFFIALLVSCKAIPPEITIPDPYNKAKDITVFIDGTAFKPSDSSNIYKLNENLKQRKDILSYYTVGVGAGPDAKSFGQFLGVGLSKDVQHTYRFICQNYSKTRNDRIHLFGFSRGAYTCKVLTNLIYTAGVLDLDNIKNEKLQLKLIKRLYKTYLSKKTADERKQEINLIIAKWETKLDIKIKRRLNVEIETLNLFDTVEALGAPDNSFNPCCPNRNHLEQFCNVKKVNHAVSIDDNRARIFTPVLASCSCISDCKNRTLDDFVNEVWFAGAHSDVGGGYKNEKGEMDDDLAQIPLKWMMNNLLTYDLFKNDLLVNETHINGKLHDAEIDYGPAFKRRNRHIYKYHKYISKYNNGKYKIHRSVIQRLENGNIPIFKHYERQNESKDKDGNHLHTDSCSKDWFEDKPFDKCFKKTDKGFQFLETCHSIEVVD
ncbi:T6SS phospholipase effector Tle1-like catalytic domain-containing protein [Winogradskyella sp. R77965]|uniref:T6SS phospholipase effector Tle1-like catalytic domain-containing protein n=1 Tax=Winogradskyella sp. R77965 TaxID=3093872 RepID=UPI0037DDDF0D